MQGNRHKRARFLHRLAVLLVHVVGTNDDVSTVAGNVSVLGRCHRDDRVRDAVLLRVRIEVRHPGRDAAGAVPLVRREFVDDRYLFLAYGGHGLGVALVEASTNCSCRKSRARSIDPDAVGASLRQMLRRNATSCSLNRENHMVFHDGFTFASKRAEPFLGGRPPAGVVTGLTEGQPS